MDIFLRLLAGVALAIFFYGGLWFTVRNLAVARNPGLLVAGSFLFRTATVLVAFVPLTGSRWEYALAAMGGFVLGRKVVEQCT